MIEQASLVIGNGNWAVKSDSLLGYKTINGKYYPREMSVVRATTGTRINEDGLVELVPYNLLQYSEQFDNATWVKLNATVTANAVTSPSGVQDADRIQITSNSNYLDNASASLLTNGATYTVSVYARSFGATNQSFRIYGNGNKISPTFTATPTWQRFEYTFTATSISPNCGIGSPSITDIVAWGYQLVEGSSALDYLPTTDRLDIARIDYSTGEPALLLEPQRTNLALQSSSFDSATWLKVPTVTANTTTSPSGVVDADLITANGTTTQHYVLQTVTSGAKTYSVFAKMGTQRYIQILTSGTPAPVANFDLQDGVANMVGYNSTASIEDYGNGWWRCILQTNDSLAANFYINYVNSLVAGRFQSILSSDTLYLWGAQAEVGSYATSYIPTTTASVTRNADQVFKTGISSLIGQTEGTMFVECSALADDATNRRITISDGTANNRIYISYKNYTNQLRIDVISAGSSVFDSTYTIADITQTAKIAVAYKLNDFAFYVNGVQAAVDTSGAVPTSMSVFKFEDGAGGNVFFGKVNQAILFPTRLTNAELATLTTI
jgi:hypothetical protein